MTELELIEKLSKLSQHRKEAVNTAITDLENMMDDDLAKLVLSHVRMKKVDRAEVLLAEISERVDRIEKLHRARMH